MPDGGALTFALRIIRWLSSLLPALMEWLGSLSGGIVAQILFLLGMRIIIPILFDIICWGIDVFLWFLHLFE